MIISKTNTTNDLAASKITKYSSKQTTISKETLRLKKAQELTKLN